MNITKTKNITVQVLFDILIFFSAFTLSFYLRGQIPLAGLATLPPEYLTYVVEYTVIIIAVKLIIFAAFGMYKKIWKYASFREFITIVECLGLSAAIMIFVFYILEAPYFPKSILIIDFLLTLALVSTSRYSKRLFNELKFGSIYTRKKRSLIVGAGDAGEMIAREMFRQKNTQYKPVAFLDDDKHKIGQQIHGIKVVGKVSELKKFIKKLSIDEVIIAMPSVSGEIRKDIAFKAREEGAVCKTLPSLYEIIDGKAQLYQIRDIQIEDILGRKPVKIEYSKIFSEFEGRSILITGAGGSIGSEICRQIIRFKPSRLVMVDNSENNIFNIEQELTSVHSFSSTVPVVADIRDKDSIQGVFKKYKPEYVFHAAAYKHVPLMQLNPEAALQNNYIGTKSLAKLCSDFGVRKFVMLSTDKAVNPNSVMGLSKALAEKYLQSLSKVKGTAYIIVRFGNVLGSKGSVVPIFKQQIEDGGPVVVTHPQMKRFFMTISEASQLVIQACIMGKGGEIYVLDMGEPINILDLARNMIRLYGLVPGKDIKINYSGVRRGEKLNEELVCEEEELVPTDFSSIFMAYRNGKLNKEEILNILFNLEKEITLYDYKNLFKDLKKIVPNFDESKIWSRQ